MSGMFWIVACGSNSKTQSKDACMSIVKSRAGPLSTDDFAPMQFNVPDGENSLKFGSFDNLIRMSDDLQKFDSQVEGIVRRTEKTWLENEMNAEFKVISQRSKLPFTQYLRQWQWDDAKYPKTRSMADNLKLMLTIVSKLDEELKNKTAQFQELKTQKSNISKKEGQQNFTTSELVDVLAPEVVIGGSKTDPNTMTVDDDFIKSEHLSTVVVAVPRGGDAEFLKTYEKMMDGCQNVVPMSARKFCSKGKPLEDKDGNTIWRVVVFKSKVEDYKKACREAKKVTVRDFEYSLENYQNTRKQRDEIDAKVTTNLNVLNKFCAATWSDVMVAWVHIKAMRVFVESVLRFGVPPGFASFIICPKSNQQTKMRNVLADILKGNAADVAATTAAAAAAGDQEEDQEEYFPYVSFNFMPFAPKKD